MNVSILAEDTDSPQKLGSTRSAVKSISGLLHSLGNLLKMLVIFPHTLFVLLDVFEEADRKELEESERAQGLLLESLGSSVEGLQSDMQDLLFRFSHNGLVIDIVVF